MSQLLPRFRRDEMERELRLGNGVVQRLDQPSCPSGKVRYAFESHALEGLARVRAARRRTADPHAPECRIYFCDRCEGWHLTSREGHPEEFSSEPERHDKETWAEYAQRLEKRIARQRSEILSLHQLGHGLSNKATRRRIETLVIALGRTTERYERERRHRIAVVELLEGRCACWWCRLRRWMREVASKPGSPVSEDVQATGGTEGS